MHRIRAVGAGNDASLFHLSDGPAAFSVYCKPVAVGFSMAIRADLKSII
jgi:ribosomal protein L27